MAKEIFEIKLDKNLLEAIKKSGLTNSGFARRAGVCHSTLHNYCYGVCPKGLENLIKVSQFLNISLDELIFDRKPLPRSSEQTFEIVIRKLDENFS